MKKKIKITSKKTKNKFLKNRVLTILLVVILICAFIILNFAVSKLNISPLDFTKSKLYTLSDDSRNLVSSINKNVDIYFFGYDDSTSPVKLAKQYEKQNDKVKIHIVSTTGNPDLASKYGATDSSNLIAVSSNQKYKVIEGEDLTTYDQTTGEQIDITEQKITNAIADVTQDQKPQVYFLSGHNEPDISQNSENGYISTVANYITNEVNDVNKLDLLTANMPERCDLLIIVNPTTDFQDIETEKIINYINNGGNILWLQDPYSNIENYNSKNFKNTQKILDLYGISFSKGIVLEGDSDHIIEGHPSMILPNLTYNDIVKDIYTANGIVFLGAGKINNGTDEEFEKLNVSKDEFVKTTSSSYYKDNIDENTTTLEKQDSDESGSFTLGEILTKKLDDNKSSKLIAYSSASFIYNIKIQMTSGTTGMDVSFTPISLRNNRDFILNSVEFLLNREDAIRIRKTTDLVSFTTPTTNELRKVLAVVLIIPILIIIAGFVISKIRKIRR